MSRDLLLVAGSGRSGTSLFANIVGNLGFHVPEPQVVADDSNPRGFGEPQWVVDKHTALLRQANVQASDARPAAWAHTARLSLDERVGDEVGRWLDDQFSRHEQIVIKDPRLLWFLPLWSWVGEDLGARVHVVTMLRHPAEVVRSKMNWYARMPLVDANRVAGWANTMLFTERATREQRRAFVRFEDLLDDWTQQVAHISARFEIPSLVNAQARAQATAGSLVDPSLRRSTASWDDLEEVPKGLIHLCEQAWNDLLALSGTETRDVTETLSRLDGHREEYVELYQNAERIAQSSIITAARQATREATEKAARQATAAPGGVRRGSLAEFLLGQVRRRVPARVRGLIPLRVKLALVNLFK
jgi:hypothetical protein